MGKLFALALLLWAAPHVGAQTLGASASEEARVREMENGWSQAIRAKDVKALELLLAPELTLVEYDGSLMTRDQYIARVAAATHHPEQVTNETLTVHAYGAIAVATGVYREKGTLDRKPYARRERFTDTWVNQHGSWVCVASHSTLIRP